MRQLWSNGGGFKDRLGLPYYYASDRPLWNFCDEVADRRKSIWLAQFGDWESEDSDDD